MAMSKVGRGLRLVSRLIGGKTSRVGKRVRGVGMALLGGAGVTGGAAASLPAAPDSYMEIINGILLIITGLQGLVGTVMLAIGQGQTDDHVDE